MQQAQFWYWQSELSDTYCLATHEREQSSYFSLSAVYKYKLSQRIKLIIVN